MCKAFIDKGYSVKMIAKYSNVSKSTFYFSLKSNEKDKRKFNKGRPIPGYTVNPNNKVVMDELIVEALIKYRLKPEFVNAGGYHKLVHYLRRDYGFFINHKKLYRICLENNILLPKSKKKKRRYGKICTNRAINGPNQLWEFDIKYGYIHGENRHFFILIFIDVFSRKVVGYHIGRSCKAGDLIFTLKNSLRYEKINDRDNNLILRSDNGPQMTSREFEKYLSTIKIDLEHEFIPYSSPNLNAHIESFNSILEIEFLQVRYFESYSEAYTETVDFISFYNKSRIHGSLNNLTPLEVAHGYAMGIDMGVKIIKI